MSAINGLSHIGIITRDMNASIAFYRDILGFELESRYANPRIELAFLRVGDCVIELVCGTDIKPPTGDGAVDHVALSVTGIDDLVAGLKAKGVSFETAAPGFIPDLFGGSANIFMRGPSGEMIEFFEVKPANETGKK